MNSKERVRTAIAHRQPDRVAIDYYAREEISLKLRERLGLKPADSLEDTLGVDLAFVGPDFKHTITKLCYADPTAKITKDGLHLDIWGCGFNANQTKTGFYMDLAYNPLHDLASIEELEAYPWPTADLWDYSTIAAQAKSNSKYWTHAHSRGIFEISWFIRGFEGFMEDMLVEPERASALMDHVQAYLMERTRRILEAARGGIDMMEYNDDIAAQNGMLMNPDTWRELVKPRVAEFIRMCKGYGVKVRYHSCGGVRPVISDLIEIGVDVLTPVQTSARGMEPEGLKKDFGDNITFNGGVDTQYLLPNGTPDEIRKETKRLIDVLGKNGGLILGPGHVFQADVPIENIVAMYETALGHTL